ncbi:MAG TPA: hypothetical protein VMS17_30665 [Gemmataceae bacterium]|nr:hypothetical protein [Gemmataceae bacterium]
MSIRNRLRRLEREVAPRRPRVQMVAFDHPPDGRTRVWLDDGTELPQGVDWRPFAVEGTYTSYSGIDIDVVLGSKPADVDSGDRKREQ